MTDKMESNTSKKKARSFDVMEMFEQARQTAIERTQSSVDEGEVTVSSVHIDKLIVDDDSSNNTNSDSSKTEKQNIPSESSNANATEEDIGPPLPPGFKQISVESSQEDEATIGPSVPPTITDSIVDPDSDEEYDDEDEEDESLENKIPASYEIVLEHSDKIVSALALDPSGARLVSGGYDFEVKFFDFAGMDASLHAFRTVRPCECHQIRSLQYSSTGDRILIVAGNAQAKVLDRDGHEVIECVKGDQYIVDMASTKGHTAMLNSGSWNPKIREEFITCSNDCTVRLWDVSNAKKHKNIIKPKGNSGRKTVPTACTYSRDGQYIAAACQDGSIQMWSQNKHTFVYPALHSKKAHTAGTDTSCISFSHDGKTLASRGGDDTLKLWDIRKFRDPLAEVNNLINTFPMTDCVFSPDDKMVATGISVKKGTEKGRLVFFDSNGLNKVSEMEISDSSVVRTLWHPKLNQIMVGCADGKVHLFYDPKISQRGAMLCSVKQKKKSKQVQVMASQTIITPYALPMFRVSRPSNTRKFEEKLRKDPVKSHRPDLPIYGPGTGGRVGAKGATLSQYVAQTLAKRKPDVWENDPRGAILRHAEEAAKNPYWVDPAYKKTQPNPVFQEPEKEKKDDDITPVWKKMKKT